MADAPAPLPDDLCSPKPATEHTRRANAAVAEALPLADRTSFDDARRGFIATLDPMTIEGDAEGAPPAFDLARLGFLAGDAPDTVNPSLWRMAQLNAQHHGLFEVVDGVYQVRSFDLANMTLIRGETGWIVVDPLTSAETSRAALALANAHLGERPVVAVIHTHSHADHFAGVLGVVTEAQIASGEIAILAPEHYVHESLSENVLAGNVMSRRATYMYGTLLEPSPRGFVSTGLGAALAVGATGFAVPNDIVRETGETRVIDGVEIEFQMTPGSEAPAEMVFYLPAHRALCMAEITSHHLHNVYTPRGAQVRDALAWSAQIQESIDRYGDRLEVQLASHHWPTWGRDEAVAYLGRQRDLYKYIHDQTLRLANHGYTPDEIAERITLPDELENDLSARGYYGTVHHDARAVYVKYLGFFDGNPARLYARPRAEVAPRYVARMGGADAVVEAARDAFDEGDYRWAVELLDHLVMADPTHVAGRALMADALEQLGYQAESAPWRNFFLSGALELRRGVQGAGAALRPTEPMARALPLASLFQSMAVRLNGAKAEATTLHLSLRFTDLDAPWLLSIERGVLHAFEGREHDAPTATLTLSSVDFKRMIMGLTNAMELIGAGALTVDGDGAALLSLRALFDELPPTFPIMSPRG